MHLTFSFYPILLVLAVSACDWKTVEYNLDLHCKSQQNFGVVLTACEIDDIWMQSKHCSIKRTKCTQSPCMLTINIGDCASDPGSKFEMALALKHDCHPRKERKLRNIWNDRRWHEVPIKGPVYSYNFSVNLEELTIEPIEWIYFDKDIYV